MALLLLGDDRAAYIARHHVTTYREKRAEVFRWYGATCVCCGEDDQVMLTLDYLSGGGSREKNYKAISIMWKASETSERYQLLCFSCNQAKAASART